MLLFYAEIVYTNVEYLDKNLDLSSLSFHLVSRGVTLENEDDINNMAN